MALAKKDQPGPAPTPKSRPEQGNGPLQADSVADLGKDVELRAYRDMLLIRRFEERAARAYTEAKVGRRVEVIFEPRGDIALPQFQAANGAGE